MSYSKHFLPIILIFSLLCPMSAWPGHGLALIGTAEIINSGMYRPVEDIFLNELTAALNDALQVYANIHRGQGHCSWASTSLVEHARRIILDYVGIPRESAEKYSVVFGDKRSITALIKYLGDGALFTLSSNAMGIPIGLHAIVVKNEMTEKISGIHPELGGGEVAYVTKKRVGWYSVPDKFEAGTPNIPGIIIMAKACQLRKKYHTALRIADQSPFINIARIDKFFSAGDGIDSLAQLQRLVVGGDMAVPLTGGRTMPHVYFDSAASTPALQPVKDIVTELFSSGDSAEIRELVVGKVKNIIKKFLTVPDSYDIIFTANSTGASNILAKSITRHNNEIDEEIVVVGSELEHNSSHLPYRFIKGVTYLRLGIDTNGFFDIDEIKGLLDEYNVRKIHGKKRIRYFVLSGASNVTGSINNCKAIVKLAHTYKAYVCMDAAQLAAHRKINIADLGLDYLFFSGHKLYAPFGSGALIARKGLLYSSDAESELIQESGEENIIGIAAMGKAMQLLMNVGMDTIEKHEIALLAYAIKELKAVGADVYGTVDDLKSRTGVISFNLPDYPRNMVAMYLAEHGGINSREGRFCSPLAVNKIIGIPDADIEQLVDNAEGTDLLMLMHPGMVRISFGLFNTREEVDRLIETLVSLKETITPGRVMIAASKRYASIPTGPLSESDREIYYRTFLKIDPSEITDPAYTTDNVFNEFADKVVARVFQREMAQRPAAITASPPSLTFSL